MSEFIDLLRLREESVRLVEGASPSSDAALLDRVVHIERRLIDTLPKSATEIAAALAVVKSEIDDGPLQTVTSEAFLSAMVGAAIAFVAKFEESGAALDDPILSLIRDHRECLAAHPDEGSPTEIEMWLTSLRAVEDVLTSSRPTSVEGAVAAVSYLAEDIRDWSRIRWHVPLLTSSAAVLSGLGAVMRVENGAKTDARRTCS